MDELSRKVFHKEESELTEYERMMLGIMAEKQAAEGAAEETPAAAPAAEGPVEAPAAAEETPAEAEEPAPVEEAPQDEPAAEEASAEEPSAEEAPADALTAEEAPVAESAAEEPVAEAVSADEPDDSDVKIAGEEPVQPKSERIPLLTEEKNPELEPVVLTRPTIQFKNSIEREKKITRKVQRHRRRSGLVVLGLCVALIFVAFLYNGIFNKSWGLLEKEEPTPVPEELIAAETGEVAQLQEPEPTPEPTPEPPPEHRYAVERADISWIGAQDLCLASGGYLAVINDMDEFNRITALADEQGIEALWVGCHRDVNSNTMVWEHGETVDKAVDPDERQMSLWAPGEPSFIDDEGTDEDYLLLWNHDGGWRYWDSIGDLTIYFGWRGRIGYVCEFDS